MADNDSRYIPTDTEPGTSGSGTEGTYSSPNTASRFGASEHRSRYSAPGIDGGSRYEGPSMDSGRRYPTPSADATGRLQPLSVEATGRYDTLEPASGRSSTLPTSSMPPYDAVDTSVSAHYDSNNAAFRTPYVRRQRPRRTQEAINDLEIDESYAQGFTHDSNVTVKGRNPLSGTVYSRSRANMPQLQRELHYGQYLSIPKGRRQIFSSRDRSAAIRTRAITSLIVVILIIIAIIAWMLIMDSVR